MARRARVRTRVVAPSSGCAARARLRVTPQERAVLTEVGEHLTRMRVADLPAAVAGEKANDRSKWLAREFGVTARYAETACADNDAAVKAARQCLYTDRRRLRAAIRHVERRLAAPPRSGCGCGQRRGCEHCKLRYPTGHERVMKRRRLDVLRAELARRRLADKRYPVVLGTARLLTTRHHLGEAGLSVERWRANWAAQRAWFGAIGNTGKPGGNPCLTLTEAGGGSLYLTVSVPRPVAERLGVKTRVRLSQPVRFPFLGEELTDRVRRRVTTRLDVEMTPDRRGRPAVYLRAAWKRPAPARVSLERARVSGVVAADFNADHFAARRLDVAGNPVGAAVRVPLDLDGQPARTRDGRLRAALTALIDYAVATGASAVAVEDLGFTEAEKSREAYGHNKTFRRLIAGFPTPRPRSGCPGWPPAPGSR